MELPKEKINVTELLLESGLASLSITVLKAYELRGVNGVPETNPWIVYNALLILTHCIDYGLSAARSILWQLQGMASTICFILENPLVSMGDLHQYTNGRAALLYALAFGREEDELTSVVEFSTADVDKMTSELQTIFSGFHTAFYKAIDSIFPCE